MDTTVGGECFRIPQAAAGVSVTYVDVAKDAGLTAPNVWDGIGQKKYIVATKGSSLAFLDYDHDGWLDVYMTNGPPWRVEVFTDIEDNQQSNFTFKEGARTICIHERALSEPCVR